MTKNVRYDTYRGKGEISPVDRHLGPFIARAWTTAIYMAEVKRPRRRVEMTGNIVVTVDHRWSWSLPLLQFTMKVQYNGLYGVF